MDMTRLKIKIQNYRNIYSDNPIELEIRDGIVFILGLNNIGKSNILRFFYEIRAFIHTVKPYLKSGSRSVKLGTQAEHFFDVILNRKSLSAKAEDRLVKIEFSDENGKVILIIRTVGDVGHSNNYLVNYTCKLNEGHESISELANKIIKLEDVMYIGAFRNINFNSTGSYLDINIGHDFIKTWSNWSGGADISKRSRLDDLIEELKELFSFKTFDIKVNDDKNDLIIKTDDGSFSINDLGGGLAHFIIVLGNALIKNPGYILIDEPEIGLHPRMQEVFVRALASKAKHGLIASSHSIGLARSVADKILSLTKLSNGELSLAPFGLHSKLTSSQVINEMGYSQFVEIGGHNILLVEGRTDIKSFREILRKFGIENKFIIISLGGGNLITATEKIYEELNEIKRLNAKSVSVIFDSEKDSANAKLRDDLAEFEKCCKDLGFNVFSTDYHSTENYIIQDAIDKIVGNQYKALGRYERFGSLSEKWSKEKNWLMFREMEKKDFDGTKLEEFISGTLMPLAIKE